MQHPDEGTIHAWLDGALSADEAARVEAHVKDCQQCEAAVAEARGFIAASSRILTALDNAPRGVIPASAPKRRIDPVVWKIAATLVVVATGTFAVLNSNSSEDRASSAVFTATKQQSETASAPSSAGSATPTIPVADEATVANGSAAPTVSAPIMDGRAKAAPGAAGSVAGQSALRHTAPELSRAAPRRADVAQSRDLAKAPIREQNFSAAAPAPLPAPPPPVAASKAAESSVAEAVGLSAKMDAVAEAPTALRIVGRPRVIGQTITLYEVSPGDTVTLMEPMNVALNSIVVTGGASQAAADGKRARAVEGAGAAAGNQAALQSAASAAPAAPPPAPSSPSFTEGANGRNTLAWTDPRTGLTNRLMGRHTRAELEQIQSRIERAKAAAADSAKKR